MDDDAVSWITLATRNGELDMISTVEDLAAEALFVSDVQPSDRPSRKRLEDAVTAMILRHGSDGCAAVVAEEFGDHPEVAVRRMCWVREELRGVAVQVTQRRRQVP